MSRFHQGITNTPLSSCLVDPAYGVVRCVNKPMAPIEPIPLMRTRKMSWLCVCRLPFAVCLDFDMSSRSSLYHV